MQAKFHMHAKRNFLEESALYETLERYRFASSASSSPSQQHVRHVIDNVLTQIEVSQLMMGAEEGSEDTLAAAETQVQKQLNSLGNFKEPLIATVEGALQERASEIALVHSTASSSTTKSLQDIVKGTEMELEWLEKWKVSSVVNRMRHNQTLTSLFNTLYNSVGLLWKMIQEFKIQHQLEKDMAFHNYFDAVIQSALLKLQ
ncbi:hypothetical protein BGW42_001326 [Actinomortierella wolfii]|nr:hypothetical protein BGW42_001326 [Actinomortierella wolfii]